MKPNQFVNVNSIVVLLLLLCVYAAAPNPLVEEALERARKQFYTAIEDENQIEPAIKLFKQIARVKPAYTGRAQVYIGALVALKGKHAFLPYNKIRWVKRGLTMMDKGLKKSPNDIEALFIRGTTCYYLPFFFRRSDGAERDFKEIIKQMPSEVHSYDPQLITHVITFLLENTRLTPDEQTYLQTLRGKLELQQPIADQ